MIPSSPFPGGPSIATLGEILGELVPVAEVTWDETVLDVPFPDLGYDSLLLMQLSRQFGDRLGVEVPAAAMLDVETPRMLLGVLASCRPSAVA